jgi:excisionase family DNA binding protein
MQIQRTSDIGSRLLTDKEVAEKLHVSVRSVIDWRNSGKLPFLRIGGRSIRYRAESIAALLEKLEVGGRK